MLLKSVNENKQERPWDNCFLSKKNTVYLLISMYLAGIIGLQWEYSREIFKFLVPFNLIFTAFVVLFFHRNWNKYFGSFIIFTILAGFFVEVLGVKTGIIFGKYHYQTTLGIKILEVPPIIGLNWLVLVYATGVFCASFDRIKVKILQNKIIQTALGASIMTFLDFLIEPVAIKFAFWAWDEPNIPLQNYVAWWFISAFLLTIFTYLSFEKNNKIATFVLLLQFLFFLVLNFVNL